MLAANLTAFGSHDGDGIVAKLTRDDGHGGIVKEASRRKMARGKEPPGQIDICDGDSTGVNASARQNPAVAGKCHEHLLPIS